MKHFTWNATKNEQLIKERSVSFERTVTMTNQGEIVDLIKYPNQERYPGQSMFIININNYSYLVPFVEDENEVFLKTIVPSRKATKKYLEK